jgi:hypothetical protein
MNRPSKALAVALLAATALWFAGPAGAVPLGSSLSLQDAAGAGVQTVAWRGGGGRGFGGGWHGGGGWRGGGWGGAAAGLAAGAIIGGAVASQPWYGYDYDYAPGYYSYGYDPGYGYASPGYVTAPPDANAYCASRFRSYDPASGTYLGYDGLRHPCP